MGWISLLTLSAGGLVAKSGSCFYGLRKGGAADAVPRPQTASRSAAAAPPPRARARGRRDANSTGRSLHPPAPFVGAQMRKRSGAGEERFVRGRAGGVEAPPVTVEIQQRG